MIFGWEDGAVRKFFGWVQLLFWVGVIAWILGTCAAKQSWCADRGIGWWLCASVTMHEEDAR